MKNKYLPIGSVVNIKGNEDKIIIIGYGVKVDNNFYDYIGYLYPQCFTPNYDAALFKNSDITNIIYEGYKVNNYNIIEDEIIRMLNSSNLEVDKNE